jgi:hypothetical protein
MVNTFLWEFEDLTAYPTHTDDNGITKSNVIFRINWKLSLTDGTNTVKRMSICNLDVSDLSSFTSYESLTKTDLESWVQASIGEERLSRTKASLENQLANFGLRAPQEVITLQLPDSNN